MKYRETIVTSPATPTAQTDTVFDAVRRADLRRRQRVARREMALAACVSLGALAGVALLRLAVPVPVPLLTLAALAALAAPATAWLRASRRQPDLPAAAAAIDRSASLHDAVTTAAWFADHQPDPSAWVDAQRARTARAAASLDVDALFPIAPPPALPKAAVGLAALLIVALLVPASWSRRAIGLVDERPFADAGQVMDDEAGADEAGASPMSPEELLAAAEQGLRGGLDSQEVGPGGDETAAGTAASSGAEAGAGEAGSVPDVAGTGPPPADAERGEPGDGTRADDTAGESLAEALDRAAEQARQAAEQAGAEQTTEEGSGEEAGGEESEGGGAGGGEGGVGTPSEGEASGAMPGGHMSGPGGDAGAEGGGLDQARAALEITLKREQLASLFAAEGGATEQPLVERQSESGTSQLAFRDVGVAAGYQGAGADQARAVPWTYRPLVRDYFLERARQQPRKDPE